MSIEVNLYMDKNFVMHINGRINFHNFLLVKEKLDKRIQKIKNISISLENMIVEDSSMIILILSTLRLHKGKQINFIKIPNKLKQLIDIYKLGHVVT